MSEYVKIIENDGSFDVVFYIDDPEIMAIGEELAAINENAYMNGYNWEALLDCYITKFAPGLAFAFEADSEADMYAAYFEKSEEGARNAETLVNIIKSLIENKQKLFRFVSEYGDEVEWD